MPRSASAAPDSTASFVETSGTNLVVDGEPYYFNGANAPWLTHTWPSTDTVDKVLAFADEIGVDVLRTGIHSVDVGGTVHSPKPGELGEDAFQHVDYVVQEAEKRGIRLVFSLVDNWDYYGGMDAYVTTSSTASKHDDFYTDEECKRWYKEYVRSVLTRKNALTGRVYRDDPTILMWELANEAEAKDAGIDVLHGWKEEMATHFKSIDSNHLLSTGSGGNYNTDSDEWMYSGGNGVDYVRNHQIPEIDVCSFHLYPEWSHSDTNEFGQQWIREHFVDAHETIGKPAFLGEFGWARDRTPSRGAVYADWFDVVDEVDGAGAAAWQLVKDDRSETSKHDIRPSHTETTSVLADFSTVQRDKQASTSCGCSSDDASTDASSLTGERLVVEGGGTDIWDQSDEFHFVHEQVGGDATMTARVSAQENTDPWAKAGVMIRDSTNGDAAHAMMILTPENGVAFQHRSAAGDWMSSTGSGGSAPQMVKIERDGDTLSGYTSPDGSSWTKVGSATVPLNEPFVGLAVTSHSAGTLSAVEFDEISGAYESRKSSWTNEDVGSVDVGGSVTRTGNDGEEDGETGDDPLSVVSGTASDVDAISATLNGELTSLGGAGDADVYFEWGLSGNGLTNATEPRSIESIGQFSDGISGLESDAEYVFRPVAETVDGRDTGDEFTFTTEPADESVSDEPSIDRFELQDRSNPAWTRVRVRWSVSDDAELESVTSTLHLGEEDADVETTRVSSSEAAGEHDLRARGGKNRAYGVTLTVSDGNGNRTTRTKSMSR